MTVCTVLEYPDTRLRQVSTEISDETISSESLAQLLTDLKETMYHKPGTVGLAAPQIGYNYRAFAMDATANGDRSKFRLVINPHITSDSRWKYGREGCLSFPEYLITIKRARRITVQYLDENLAPHEEQLEEFEAVIFQHELDHLNGVLFIDLARDLDTDLIKRQN